MRSVEGVYVYVMCCVCDVLKACMWCVNTCILAFTTLQSTRSPSQMTLMCKYKCLDINVQIQTFMRCVVYVFMHVPLFYAMLICMCINI
jgi:hypothetical protein